MAKKPMTKPSKGSPMKPKAHPKVDTHKTGRGANLGAWLHPAKKK